VAEQLLPEALVQPGMVACQLLETDEAARDVSRAGHVRSGDRSLAWAVLLEATAADALAAVRATLLGNADLLAAGAAEITAYARMRMLYRIGR
jgi:hypothetical protein